MHKEAQIKGKCTPFLSLDPKFDSGIDPSFDSGIDPRFLCWPRFRVQVSSVTSFLISSLFQNDIKCHLCHQPSKYIY